MLCTVHTHKQKLIIGAYEKWDVHSCYRRTSIKSYTFSSVQCRLYITIHSGFTVLFRWDENAREFVQLWRELCTTWFYRLSSIWVVFNLVVCVINAIITLYGLFRLLNTRKTYTNHKWNLYFCCCKMVGHSHLWNFDFFVLWKYHQCILKIDGNICWNKSVFSFYNIA